MEGGDARRLSRPRGVVQVHCKDMEASPKGRQRQRGKRWRRKGEKARRAARGPEEDPGGEEGEEQGRSSESVNRARFFDRQYIFP